MASFPVSSFFANAVVKSPYASEWEVVEGTSVRGARLVHKSLKARAAKKAFTQVFHHVFRLVMVPDSEKARGHESEWKFYAVAREPYRSYFE